MVLGDGIDDMRKKDKKSKYRGTSQGRYTKAIEYGNSPNVSPDKDSVRLNSGQKSTQYESKKEEEKKSSTKYSSAKKKKSSNVDDDEEIKNSELEQSFRSRGTFNTVNQNDSQIVQKIPIKKCAFYVEGPITKYLDTIYQFPQDIALSLSTATVAKIA